MNINFSEYTLEELVQSLEDVDELEFPDNAMKIYKLVLEKLSLDYRAVDAKALGYESGVFSEVVFLGLFSFPFESLIKEQHILNADMREKIKRLNDRLSKDNI
jgi:hypothetical protein